jgi:biopolymer transport protein ExbD
MNLKPRRHEEPEINVVSLIDVVLLLVVFFMLSTHFTQEGRLHVVLPRAQAVPAARERTPPVVVTVTASGDYLVNGRELLNNSPDTLRAALAAEPASARAATVLIRADARATQQSVVTAMDVLGELGFAKLDIATIKARLGSGA